MAMTSTLLGCGMGLVLVEFEYEYQGRDGVLVSIKPNERYILLAKTNDHWWHVRKDSRAKPFYIPAKYVKELPADFPSPLDFADPPSPEPVLVPVAVPIPVPVPVLKTTDRAEDAPSSKSETPNGGGRLKPGDEVTIRLRSDAAGYKKKENRMSTFGVPVEFHDPPPLVTPAYGRSGQGSDLFSHNTAPDTGSTTAPSATTNMADSALTRKRPSLSGSMVASVMSLSLDDPSVSLTPRVPSFSPADPLPPHRPQTHPIPVETPVIPQPPPPTSSEEQPESPLEPEEEEEAEESSSVEESREEEEEEGGGVSQEDDSSHIYESIQDLNLDVDSLVAGSSGNTAPAPGITPVPGIPAVPSALPDAEPSTATAHTQGSVSANTAVYANVTDLKKTTIPQPISVSVTVSSPTSPSGPALSSRDPSPSPSGHTPSSSLSSPGLLSPASPLSPQEGWQVHTDRDSGKVFYYHPATGQTTWADPRSPPPPSSGDMDQPRGREGGPGSPSPLLSPASSQGSCGWEQLLDETSGRHYYYNPGSGATSWVAPELLTPSSPSSPGSGSDTGAKRQDHGPPPLPEEDYPTDDLSEPDTPSSVFTREPLQGKQSLIPRAQLDSSARTTNPPAGWTRLTDPGGKTVYSSLQTQQQWVQSVDEKGKTYYYMTDGSKSRWNLPELPAAPSSLQPQRPLGNGVDADGPPLPLRNWRHSMAPPSTEENKFFPSHRRNVSDYSDASSTGNSPEATHHGHLLEKAGILNKTKVADNGKRIRKNWSQSWTVLHGGILTFHRDPKSAPTGTSSKTNQIVPEYTVELRGATLNWASKDKSSKRNVLELKTRQGCEYLVQYDTESIICDWHKVLLDTIKQLDQEHLSEEDEEDNVPSDKEDKDRKRTSTRSTSGTVDTEQGRVRTKLRKFLQRRPTLQSVKEKGYIRDNVFGCHLDTLCHRENNTVPKFIEKCIRSVERRGLDVDGIYRVSGNLAVIQRLRHKADHEENLDLEDGQWDEIHVIAGALKLFLRELPEPLFPFSFFDKFIAAIKIQDYGQRVSYMRDLVMSLPLPNHDTMELLFRHLHKVIDHGESNRMSVQSVAIVFGPTLLRPQTESANITLYMVFQNQIVELILNEFQTVFPQRA